MIFVTPLVELESVEIFLRNLFGRSIKKFKPSAVVSQKLQEEENGNDKIEISNYLV